jgi:hypothetical protein
LVANPAGKHISARAYRVGRALRRRYHPFGRTRDRRRDFVSHQRFHLLSQNADLSHGVNFTDFILDTRWHFWKFSTMLNPALVSARHKPRQHVANASGYQESNERFPLDVLAETFRGSTGLANHLAIGIMRVARHLASLLFDSQCNQSQCGQSENWPHGMLLILAASAMVHAAPLGWFVDALTRSSKGYCPLIKFASALRARVYLGQDAKRVLDIADGILRRIFDLMLAHGVRRKFQPVNGKWERGWSEPGWEPQEAKKVRISSDLLLQLFHSSHLYGLTIEFKIDSETTYGTLPVPATPVWQLKGWEAEKQRYEMKQTEAGATVYVMKPDAIGSETPHWICATCYTNGKKSILQASVAILPYPNDSRLWVCAGCPTKIGVSWGTEPGGKLW